MLIFYKNDIKNNETNICGDLIILMLVLMK